jgi:hypothetical protein
LAKTAGAQASRAPAKLPADGGIHISAANSEGACPTYKGAGVIYTDFAMMACVTTVCEDCGCG